MIKTINNKELDSLVGGTVASYISSAIVNAFTNVIKVLMDAGHEFGSSLRRISEGSLCPLK